MTLPSPPYLIFEAANEDVVGLRRLLNASDLGLSVHSHLESSEIGVLVVPDVKGRSEAYLSGEMIDFTMSPANDEGAARLMARPIIGKLNALASGLDPNFRPIRAISAVINPPLDPFGKARKYDLSTKEKERTGSTLGRHIKQFESLVSRAELTENDKYVALVMDTLIEPASWTAIAAAFETIKTNMGVKELKTAKLCTKTQESEFGKAANNRTDRVSGSRHGITKKNEKMTYLDHLAMMNLHEARELHRQVVNRYLDKKTGHRTAYEPVDTLGFPQLRFGLDSYVHLL